MNILRYYNILIYILNNYNMSILCVGDVHIQVSNLRIIEQLTSKLLSMIDTHNPDIVVLMGDILHSHERLHTTCFNYATHLISSLCKKKKTYILVGNHDYINNSQFLTTNHWMNCFKTYDNCIIVDKVHKIRIGEKEIVLCPYVPDGRFTEALDTIDDWKECDYILAHQLLDGAKMGAIVAEGVEKWNDEYPMLISGHIHDKQTISKNIYYTGSCAQHAFGESLDKTVLLLNLCNDEYKEIDLQLPKKKILYIEYLDIDGLDIDSLDEEIQYKISIDGEYTDFISFKKSTKYKKLISRGVKVVFKQKKKTIEKNKDKITKNIKDNNGMSFSDILLSLVSEDRDLLDILQKNLKVSSEVLKSSSDSKNSIDIQFED